MKLQTGEPEKYIRLGASWSPSRRWFDLWKFRLLDSNVPTSSKDSLCALTNGVN